MTTMEEKPIMKGFQGGPNVSPQFTTGGRIATTTEQPAFPDFHRKLTDPSAFAWLALGVSFTLLGVNLIGARGIQINQSAVAGTVTLGSLTLTIAVIFEFISGRTFPATLSGVYAGFFGGFSIMSIGWSGITGSYDGQMPNPYSGMLNGELHSAQGLWISTFVIINFCLLIVATRQSAFLLAFLTSLQILFILLMIDYFRNPLNRYSPLSQATGIFGIISGILAWYLGAASLLTKDSAFFVLPTFPLVKEDLCIYVLSIT